MKIKEKGIKLKDVIISCAFNGEYFDDKFNKYMENNVTHKHSRFIDKNKYKKWIGKEKYVNVWYELDNDIAIGFNENPNRGYKFIVKRIK
jgi:hypothetical protein